MYFRRKQSICFESDPYDVSREDAIILVEGYMDAVSLVSGRDPQHIGFPLGHGTDRKSGSSDQRYTKNV